MLFGSAEGRFQTDLQAVSGVAARDRGRKPGACRWIQHGRTHQSRTRP
jgi:hypothetical protein